MAAQNKVTAAYLNAIPEREAIQHRLTDLMNFARYTAPHKVAGRYYYSKNDGLFPSGYRLFSTQALAAQVVSTAPSTSKAVSAHAPCRSAGARK